MSVLTSYLGTLARVNKIESKNGPLTWYFYPGMLQDSWAKWWADWKIRHACHEGIDILFYSADGPRHALPPGTRIPALARGTILNITKDLLGHSIVVSYHPESHQTKGAPKQRDQAPDPSIPFSGPVLVYSHTAPVQGLSIGDQIEKDQIIAGIFDTRTIKSKLLSHLHLSCILIETPCPYETLNWTLFADRKQVTYVNPIFL